MTPALRPEELEGTEELEERWMGMTAADRVAVGGCLLNVTTKVPFLMN
jgi:hypothetical protein